MFSCVLFLALIHCPRENFNSVLSFRYSVSLCSASSSSVVGDEEGDGGYGFAVYVEGDDDDDRPDEKSVS